MGTYVFDLSAILVMLVGKPPVPLALMLLFFAGGGFIIDVFGARGQHWTGTKVRTSSVGDIRFPPSTLCMGSALVLILWYYVVDMYHVMTKHATSECCGPCVGEAGPAIHCGTCFSKMDGCCCSGHYGYCCSGRNGCCCSDQGRCFCNA